MLFDPSGINDMYGADTERTYCTFAPFRQMSLVDEHSLKSPATPVRIHIDRAPERWPPTCLILLFSSVYI